MKHIISACFFLLSLSAFSQNVTVTVDKTVTLKEFFKQIENQTDFKFAFTDQIDTSQKYFAKKQIYTNMKIEQLVYELNKTAPIQFSIVGNNIFVKQKVSKTPKKKMKLTGKVLDNTGHGVIGANIYIKELETGAMTDKDGYFEIEVAKGSYTVVSSYVGFKNKERQVEISENVFLTFNLEDDSQQLDQVIVTGSRAVDVKNTQMSVNKLTMEDIKKMPAVMGEPDPLKSLMTLPGVSNSGEASIGFNVRGGAADQNLILLDGAPVFGESHMFGFFSVFNADMVSSMELYKGGIPSKYGGRVSSVLDVNQQTGDLEKYKVDGGIGLIFSRLVVQGPLKKGKGSFIFGGRTSYAHLFLDANGNVKFYDLNAKINYRFNANNSVSFSGYTGSDVLGLGEQIKLNFGNTMGIVSWKHKFSDNLNTNLSAFYSDYQFKLDLEIQGFRWKNMVQTYGLKYNWTQSVNDNFKLNYGIEGTYYNFNPGTIKPIGPNSQYNYRQLDQKHSFEAAAYLDFEHQITEKLNLRYGLRYSMFNRLGSEVISTYDNGNAVVYNPLYNIYQEGTPTGSISYKSGETISKFDNFEPRAALSYSFNDDASVKASYNRMAQYIHMLSNSQSPFPINLWTPSGPFAKPQLLDQFAVGYFKNFKDRDYSFEGELFYKKIQNRIDYVDGADLIANNNIEQVILNGKARSYGMEILLRKNTGRFNGWISYTLSKAEQKTPGRTPEEPGIANGNWYLSGYDKLHNLNVVGTFEYSKKWSYNANFSLQSGRPVTYADGYYEFGDFNVPNYSLRNSNRLPTYHHLDLSATYTPKPEKKQGWQSYWVFSIYNIYNRQNAASITFTANDDTGINETRKLSIYGLVPGVSYNFKF